MADQGISKAAKKNKKKREKKKGFTDVDDMGFRPAQIRDMLKEQLEKAKADKDHKKAGLLRDQIWVMTDLCAGVKTDIPDSELEEILQMIEVPDQNKAASAGDEKGAAKVTQTTTVTQSVPMSDGDKEIRKLKKKLDQIEKLKDKQKKGEKLEANQVDKIKSEDNIKAEIAELEEIIASVKLKL